MVHEVYTIGYSTHSINRFIDLLSTYFVSMVVDVRSYPYSRFNSQFNRESLGAELVRADISYTFMGNELGARTENRSCYVEGKVQYDLLARSQPFQKGLERIVEDVRHQKIALMCAEGDPLICHRSILICRYLADLDMDVKHILADGRLENHEEAISRLLHEYGLGDGNLFKTREELIAEAYDRRGQEIAYISKELSSDLKPRRIWK